LSQRSKLALAVRDASAFFPFAVKQSSLSCDVFAKEGAGDEVHGFKSRPPHPNLPLNSLFIKIEFSVPGDARYDSGAHSTECKNKQDLVSYHKQ